MVLPIVAYGHPTLRKKAQEVSKDYPGLHQLIEDMFETMKVARGVGLAAPQVNHSIRMFMVDATPYANDYPEAVNFKKVFINPEILEEKGEEWVFNEGCLSLPDIHEDVVRKPDILLSYRDENFQPHEEWFSGIVARIIQHEYDHVEGVLLVDHLSALKKIMLKRKLTDISIGKSGANYKMILPSKKK